MTFDYEIFCTELTENACKQIPSDIELKDKKFIWNNVYYYSLLSARKIMQKGWDTDNTSIISQYVAEWTLKIAVDLYYSNIRKKYQNIILDSISYKAFTTAKLGLENELNQSELNSLLKKNIYDDCKSLLDADFNSGRIPELNYRMALFQISKYLTDNADVDEIQARLNKISVTEAGRFDGGINPPKITVREFYWGGILILGILSIFIHAVLMLVIR